tara:strand:- start:68 stop:199 length:132 start_codon:yes stop_codon:yes gene_type:complete
LIALQRKITNKLNGIVIANGLKGLMEKFCSSKILKIKTNKEGA